MRTGVMVPCMLLFAASAALSGEVRVFYGEDHRLVPRCGGFSIESYDVRDHDTYLLPVGWTAGPGRGDCLELRGRVTRIRYRGPGHLSTADIHGYYERCLSDGGFNVLFTGWGARLGDWHGAYYRHYFWLRGHRHHQRFLSAKYAGGDRDVYVAVYATHGRFRHPLTQVDVIEVPRAAAVPPPPPKPEKKPLVFTGAEFEGQLAKNGRALIRGIEFSGTSAELKGGSDAALKQVAAFIEKNPTQTFSVRYYTDSNGSPEFLRNLATVRAVSIVQELQTRYGISKDSMTAQGMGWVPVGDTRAPESAYGNRVELMINE